MNFVHESWCNHVHYFGITSQLPAIIISCGVHGNETGPIHAVHELQALIFKEKVSLARSTLIIYANPPAIQKQIRFVEFNMNRLFNLEAENRPFGVSANTPELLRAKQLEDCCARFNAMNPQGCIHLDLHSTIKPSVHSRFALQPVQNQSYRFDWKPIIDSFQLSAWVQQTQRSQTFSQYSQDVLRIEAVTLECGNIGDDRETPILQALISIHENNEHACETHSVSQYRVEADIIKKSEDFNFVVKESDPNFTAIKQGQAIYQNQDFTHHAEKDFYSLFFNSHVAVNQRAGLLLAPVNTEEGNCKMS